MTRSLTYAPVPGLVINGETKGIVDPVSNKITIKAGLDASKNSEYDFYYTYSDESGVLIGAKPPSNTPTLILQGQNSQYIPIKYFATNHGILPTDLEPGQLLLRSNNKNNLLLRKEDIVIGKNENEGMVFYNGEWSNNTSSTNNYNYQFSFSQASRKIDGVIRREIEQSKKPDSLKLIQNDFYRSIPSISLISEEDAISGGFFNEEFGLGFKNPSFTENRDVVYEFSYSPGSQNNVADLKTESINYLPPSSRENIKKFLPQSNRKDSRADTLSLSLNDPNYLMESVRGTVVDIYGNLLDLNRFPIKNNLTSNAESSGTNNYYKIRENQRRSIAYHFEINARKDLGKLNNPPDVMSTSDYSRNRSRFFIDIDKEGQFKINVPASSESGNIPLLTRYENYNTVASAKDPSINPNELLFPSNRIDILHDSFAAGIVDYNVNYDNQKNEIKEKGGYNRGLISIKNKEGAEVSPIDRISDELTGGKLISHIKHGTVYHDITATCIAHQVPGLTQFLYDRPSEWNSVFPYKTIDNSIVGTTITVGENAGGRSGSINLDGSIELNVGANTKDRQSIWLDTAGGMIANIGKDKNNVSAAVNMDGQLLLQIGGFGISQDSRFNSNNNAYTSGAIDIRVLVEGANAAVIRVDKNGIFLISPTKIYLESNGSIDIRSSSNISITGETVTIQDRVVEKAVTSTNPTI